MDTAEIASALADMPSPHGMDDDISSMDEEDPKDKDFCLSDAIRAAKRKDRHTSDEDIVAGTPPTTPTGRVPLSKVRRIISTDTSSARPGTPAATPLAVVVDSPLRSLTPTLPSGVRTSTPSTGSAIPGSSGTSSIRSRTPSAASGAVVTPSTRGKAPLRRGKGRDVHDSFSDDDFDAGRSDDDGSGKESDGEGRPRRKVRGESPILFETQLAFQEGYVNSGKHPIYDYFVRHKADADNATAYVMCIVITKKDDEGQPIICGVCLAQGKSTTGMMVKHLKSQHTQAANEFDPRHASFRMQLRELQRLKKQDADFRSVGEAEGSRKGANKGKRYLVRSVQQLQFDMELTQMLADCNLPWTLAENPAFQRFVWGRDPYCNFKSAATLSAAKLPILFHQVKREVFSKIKKDVQTVQAVCFTADGWSSRSMDKYLGVTAHYITDHWKMERFVVACRPQAGRSTAQVIAIQFDNTVKEIGLEPSVYKSLVTDNATNMILAGKLSKDQVQEHLRCFDHNIQLVVNAGLKQESLLPVISACKKLVARTHSSDLMISYLKNVTEELNKNTSGILDDGERKVLTYVKFVGWNETRWNSMFMMFKSIIHMRKQLEHVRDIHFSGKGESATPKSLQSCLPTIEQLDIVDGILPVLAHFQQVTDFMSGEKYPTVNYVIGQIFFLHKMCELERGKSFTPVVIHFIDTLVEQLEVRYPERGTANMTYNMACLLNPALRGNCLVQKEVNRGHPLRYKLDITVASLLEEEEQQIAAQTRARDLARETEEAVAVATPEEVLDPFMSYMRTMAGHPGAGRVTDLISVPRPLKAEVTLYLSTTDGFGEVTHLDQLRWWQEREQKFPGLCQIVRKLFSVQASSSSVERVFSTGGLIVTQKRTNLKPEKVHQLVFIRENLKRLTLRKLDIESKDEKEIEKELEDN